jgi:hypothetical protein
MKIIKKFLHDKINVIKSKSMEDYNGII